VPLSAARDIPGPGSSVSPIADDRFHDSGRPRRTCAINGEGSSGSKGALAFAECERPDLVAGAQLLPVEFAQEELS
jgi:hypothetical protein